MHRPLTRPANMPRHRLPRTNASACVPRPTQERNTESKDETPAVGSIDPTQDRTAQWKVKRSNARSTAPMPRHSMARAHVRPHTLAFDGRGPHSAGNGSFEPHCAVRPCVGSTNPAFSPNTSLPPPPSHATVSQRWIFIAFRPRSCILHLPRMQQRAGGGSYAV